jgi:hypothetical protein
MMAPNFGPPPVPGATALDGHDVVEIPLLLTARQAAALCRASRRRGMTAGQLARRVLADFLGRGARPARGRQTAPRRRRGWA